MAMHAIHTDSRDIMYLHVDPGKGDTDEDSGSDHSVGSGNLFERQRMDNLRYCGMVCCLPAALLSVMIVVVYVAFAGWHRDSKLNAGSTPDEDTENLQMSLRKRQSDTCDQVPAGTCVESCCLSGMTCWRRSQATGLLHRLHALYERIKPGPGPESPEFCEAKSYEASDVCLDPTDHSCIALVNNITAEAHNWVLIITSGGGGGHLAAAKNIGAIIEIAWKKRLAAVSEMLEVQGFSLLNAKGYAAMSQTLDSVRASVAPIELVDIMNSPCTNLLGDMVHLGGVLEGTWDIAQRQGDIQRLKLLSEPFLELSMNPVFGRQCHDYMHNVLFRNYLPRSGRPSQVISVEPVFLWPIVKAATDAKTFSVHQHMTDLPGKDANNFFAPIRDLVDNHHERAKSFFLHTVGPPDGNVNEIAEQTHLDPSQIIIEPFMPISPRFFDGTLPHPGEAIGITIKAQLLSEEQFLGGQEKTFQIAVEDTLTLVMLGSQPTAAALYEYFNQIRQLGQQNRKGSHIDWFFVGCGPHKNQDFADLYSELARRANALEQDQIATGRTIRFVPFTGQPAQMMEGRADTTVTRSGGMTCGELLALKKRGDHKRILLHVEPLGDERKEPPTNADEFAQWQDSLLEAGMVSWEANNARYMMTAVAAQVITPYTFASVMRLEVMQ